MALNRLLPLGKGRAVRNIATSMVLCWMLGPIWLSADPVLAQEKAPVAVGPTVDRARVERLIADLRSPNRDPNPTRESGPVRLPPDYDRKAQERVEAARRELIAMGKDAFPVLIEHANDAGYSQSIYTSIFSSQSVGGVCREIIVRQINPVPMLYKMRIGADGEWHGYQCLSSIDYSNSKSPQEALQKWWLDHQDQSLVGIQREALRWQIKREEEIGFPKPKDREYFLDPLIRMLDELMVR
jgi:hypothetical protein